MMWASPEGYWLRPCVNGCLTYIPIGNSRLSGIAGYPCDCVVPRFCLAEPNDCQAVKSLAMSRHIRRVSGVCCLIMMIVTEQYKRSCYYLLGFCGGVVIGVAG